MGCISILDVVCFFAFENICIIKFKFFFVSIKQDLTLNRLPLVSF